MFQKDFASGFHWKFWIMGFSKGPTPPNATFPPPQAKGLLTTMIVEKKSLGSRPATSWTLALIPLSQTVATPDSQAYLLLGNLSCYEIIHSPHLKWEQLNLMIRVLRWVIKVGSVGGTPNNYPPWMLDVMVISFLRSLLILELMAE